MIIKLFNIASSFSAVLSEWGLLWCGRCVVERDSAALWTEQIAEGFLRYLKVVGSLWRLLESLIALLSEGCVGILVEIPWESENTS